MKTATENVKTSIIDSETKVKDKVVSEGEVTHGKITESETVIKKHVTTKVSNIEFETGIKDKIEEECGSVKTDTGNITEKVDTLEKRVTE